MKADEFASNIFALFPPYRDWDDARLQIWTEGVTSECEGFSDAVRAEAFKSLRRTKHEHKPPQIALILEHCREAKRSVDAERRSRELATISEPEAAEIWSIDRIKWADVILDSPIGKKAAKEGWVLALRSFLRDHGRAPNDAETAALKRSVKEFHALREQLHRGMLGNLPFAAVLTKWSDDIVARQKKLEARFG